MNYPQYFMDRQTREAFIRSSDTDLATFQVLYSGRGDVDRTQRQRKAQNKEELDSYLKMRNLDRITETEFVGAAVDLCYDIKRIGRRLLEKYGRKFEEIDKLKKTYNDD